MSLSNEQIQKLLAKSNEPKSRGGRKPKGWIDTSSRDYSTWFKLHHKLYDEEAEKFAECSNPNCTDTREGGQAVAEVSGVLMCRICFLAGYMLTSPEQAEL